MYKMKCGNSLIFANWLHWFNDNFLSARRAVVSFTARTRETVAANTIRIEV